MLLAMVAAVHYELPRARAGWELDEETMPESVLHDKVVSLLCEVLRVWAKTRDALVARNLAVRWVEENPAVGVDPDVCVISPSPEEGDALLSVRTWLTGHSAPLLAVEVVSETNPRKDYAIAPDKYAASGTQELWIYDPLLSGPAAQGGPYLLQVWSRNEQGVLVRKEAGDGPFVSAALSATVLVVDGFLRIASADGTLWPTGVEAERAEKDVALARVAELERRLGERSEP